MSKIVNKRELADIVGKSERTLTEWQELGMPVELVGGRGLENEYDTVKVIEWQIQRALSGERHESGRQRLDRLDGDRKEMEIAERARELVPVRDVESMLMEGIVAARTEMLSLAERLKGIIDDRYRVNVDPVIIENEVLQTLNKLAARGPNLVAAIEADSSASPEGGA